MKRIYLITHLYNIDDKIRTCKLESFLKENFDVEVYMPYRDSKEENIDESVWKKSIFSQDIDELKKSDILIGYVDGPDFDEGIGFEIGYAKAIGKQVIILNSDFIRYNIDDKVFSKIDPLLHYLKIDCLHIEHSLDFDNFCSHLQKKHKALLELINLNIFQDIDKLERRDIKYESFIECGNGKYFYHSFKKQNISKRLYTTNVIDDIERLLASKRVYVYSNGMQMHFGSAIVCGICYALKIPFFIIDDRVVHIQGKEIMKTNLMIDVSSSGYISVEDFNG